MREEEALIATQSEKKIYRLEKELARLPCSIWRYTPLKTLYSVCKQSFIKEVKRENKIEPKEKIQHSSFKKYIKGTDQLGRRLFITEKLRIT